MTQLDPAAKFIIDAAPAPESFYAEHRKIYPKLARGTFRNVKWAVMVVTLGIYYLLPWVRWDRGPNLPDQAFLLDFANQRLFFGPIEIWAQEFYYITGVLVLAALSLFLVTAVAGRMWCGYACPQTVWTDLMVTVERFFQGDRNARLRLDASPWTLRKIWKKGATHVTWLLIALATGGVFVFYFRDAPTLWAELWTGNAPLVAYAFVAIFTATTYTLGGFAREQVCNYMCPWPRIQAAMFDAEFAARLLPRLSRRAARSAQEGAAVGRPRRLRRLQSLHRGLPGRHRHPRRLAVGMHPVRAVHRCLQRHHGQARPPTRADRLRHLPQSVGELGRAARACAPRTSAHRALHRPHRARDGHHGLRRSPCAPTSRSASSRTAIRCS